jgi:hypothetical protein
MAQHQDLEQTITSVSGRPGPVLSAYLSVNADIPENQGRSYLVRLRDAMNDEGVPEGLQRRVREYTEEEKHPEAHVHSFYKELGELTRDITFHERVQRLILAGPRVMLGENEDTDTLRDEFGV